MDGRVNVRVVTRNRIGGEEETLRFAGEGVLRRRSGGWLLHYDAVSETDGTVTESSVRLTDEPIHIALRSGACLLHLDPETQTQARLLEGEQDSTPMTVTTREAEWRLDAPDEGQIIMHYLLTLGGGARLRPARQLIPNETIRRRIAMNMIQSAKDQVLALTMTAYETAAAEGLLPADVSVKPSVRFRRIPPTATIRRPSVSPRRRRAAQESPVRSRRS